MNPREPHVMASRVMGASRWRVFCRERRIVHWSGRQEVSTVPHARVAADGAPRACEPGPSNRPRTVATLPEAGFVAAKKRSLEVFQREVRR